MSLVVGEAAECQDLRQRCPCREVRQHPRGGSPDSNAAPVTRSGTAAILGVEPGDSSRSCAATSCDTAWIASARRIRNLSAIHARRAMTPRAPEKFGRRVFVTLCNNRGAETCLRSRTSHSPAAVMAECSITGSPCRSPAQNASSARRSLARLSVLTLIPRLSSRVRRCGSSRIAVLPPRTPSGCSQRGVRCTRTRRHEGAASRRLLAGATTCTRQSVCRSLGARNSPRAVADP